MVGLLPLEECILVRVQVRQQKMDYDDINSRLKRLYLSLGQRFETNIFEHEQSKVARDGNKVTVTISFDGKHDVDETRNRINTIISNLANLKDHLKTKLKQKGGNPQEIENEINQSLPLQLVLDLNNQEKHGYPLKETKRSKKDPKIINVSKGISSIPGMNATRFIRDSITGAGHTDNMAVVITGEVVDGQGNLLYSFNDLINRSSDAWETIVTKFHLNQD